VGTMTICNVGGKSGEELYIDGTPIVTVYKDGRRLKFIKKEGKIFMVNEDRTLRAPTEDELREAEEMLKIEEEMKKQHEELMKQFEEQMRMHEELMKQHEEQMKMHEELMRQQEELFRKHMGG
jgi:hypothetical protein